MAEAFLITGVMAAGKSTVAQRLAERLPMSLHVRGDAFRRMIVNGRIEMGADASTDALDQLRLRYRAAAAAAEVYARGGFTIVYQDVILGPLLAEVVALHRYAPLHVIVLCPAPAVVAAREAARAKTGYHGFSVESLDRVLRSETPRIGYWLDSSALDVDATVDAILANRGHALPPPLTTAD